MRARTRIFLTSALAGFAAPPATHALVRAFFGRQWWSLPLELTACIGFVIVVIVALPGMFRRARIRALRDCDSADPARMARGFADLESLASEHREARKSARATMRLFAPVMVHIHRQEWMEAARGLDELSRREDQFANLVGRWTQRARTIARANLGEASEALCDLDALLATSASSSNEERSEDELTRGTLLILAGRHQEGLREIERASVSEMPAFALLAAGDAHRALADHVAAASSYERVIASLPNTPYAVRARERLDDLRAQPAYR
jgi:tetratricopeptide (TPR) repeat protein